MALQVKTFSLSQLTLASATNFHDRVNKAIVEATAAALHLETLATSYDEVVKKLLSVVNRQAAYITTEQLASLDKERDYGVGTIHNVVDANRNSLVKAKRDAAAALIPQLVNYRKIRYSEYSKQTIEVRGMLTQLRLAKNATAVAALGIEDEMDAVEAANEAFDQAFEQRTQEAKVRADQSEVKSKEVLDEAYEIYKQICQIVNAYAIVQPTDEINTFIEKVNGYVQSFSEIIDGNTSGGSTEEQPGTPSEETPENPDGEGGEQTTPTEPDDDTEGPVPGEDTDGDGSPEVV